MHLTAPRDVPSQRTKRARLPGSRLEGASPTCNCLHGGPLERRCQQNSVLLDGREARAVESAEQFCAHGPDVIQLPVREVFRDAARAHVLVNSGSRPASTRTRLMKPCKRAARFRLKQAGQVVRQSRCRPATSHGRAGWVSQALIASKYTGGRMTAPDSTTAALL